MVVIELLKIDWGYTGININGERFNHMCFADDIVLTSDRLDHANDMLNRSKSMSQQVALNINVFKKKFMIDFVNSDSLKIGGTPLDQVIIYKYKQDIQIRRDNQTCRIYQRIRLVSAAYGNLKICI